ncbi:formate dehydrogenase accessory sulfurtransferase FdhD [Salicibibacter halophilus]|uniref:Sulfur carrier protein FdhD n=1 Tax=Salicibibacter halophilus TaxID=2502791 RepID=A0A514LJZ7_9BACI|nr:formate dehydrogenase accessory sulfurtransferase FdhD [Salicibibacter halophilus]QDI92186.1 formate dehydrogenase accessory sulfurtransferase FdhD [Salicibibacter halophilus]
MTGKTQISHPILRYENGSAEWKEDIVAAEYPVTIKINGEEFVTMVCTPDYIEDMAIGYLASEGVIARFNEVKELRADDNNGYVHVTLTKKIDHLHQQMQNKRYITSCCGMSRQSFVFAADVKTTKTMRTREVAVSPDDCFRLMEEMQQSAETFQETGGVHNAALCTLDRIVLMRVDIGRHNALDKIYGYCLKHGISLQDKIIVFSGRLSSEILLKVAKIGCEVVLSKSAPTERALELAEDLEITSIGFIRSGSLNVYTVPERVALP